MSLVGRNLEGQDFVGLLYAGGTEKTLCCDSIKIEIAISIFLFKLRYF